jgi:hypothetical protein
MEVPVVGVVGHGQAGKDTFAQYLAQYGPWRVGRSTSAAAAPLIARIYDEDVETLFERRREHRQYWYEFCCELRESDPALLSKMVASTGDIVIGLRDSEELEATRRDRVTKCIFWVERPDVDSDPTTKVTREQCDLIVVNSGSMDELREKARAVASLAGCL